MALNIFATLIFNCSKNVFGFSVGLAIDISVGLIVIIMVSLSWLGWLWKGVQTVCVSVQSCPAVCGIVFGQV